MKNLKKVLKEIATCYNLSEEHLFVSREYTQHLANDWYAIIVEHMESDTYYLAEWCSNKLVDLNIRQYQGIDDSKVLSTFCEFIAA